MSSHHNPQGLIFVHTKFRLQNRHDELTGREIIVEQDTLCKRGRSAFISSWILGLVIVSVMGGAPYWARIVCERLRDHRISKYSEAEYGVCSTPL